MPRETGTVLPPSVRAGRSALPEPVSLRLQPLASEERRRNPEDEAWQVGVSRTVPGPQEWAGEWQTTTEGRLVWRAVLESPGAAALRAHFSNFSVGSGRVWLYPAGQESLSIQSVAGPYGGRGLFPDGDFWSGVLVGDRIVIEYEPAPEDRGRVPFRLDRVSHLWEWGSAPAAPRGPAALSLVPSGVSAKVLMPVSSLPLAAPCHLDASCFSAYDQPGNSVAQYTFQDEAGRAMVCSGVLLATRNNSRRPYFLTSAQCAGTQQRARTVQVQFFLRTTSCDGGEFESDAIQRITGATYLAGAPTDRPIERGDFSLLELMGTVPESVPFAQWDPQGLAADANVVGVHYPSGSFRRITFGQRVGDRNAVVLGQRAPGSLYYTVRHSQGRTQPGSTGSPLLDEGGRVVGLLSYNPTPPKDGTVCDLSTSEAGYSRFSSFYPEIRRFLEDEAPVTATLAAEPNPVRDCVNGRGRVRLTWNASSDGNIEIRLGAADGPVVATGSSQGTFETEQTVTDGTAFHLVRGGVSLARVVVRLECAARSLTVGQLVESTLSESSVRRNGCDGCFAERFQFSLDAPQTVTVAMNSSAFDAYLVLLDARGNVVAQDDNSGGGTNARIARSLSPGRYTVEASSAGGGATGPFNLTVFVGNTTGARALASGETVNATLAASSTRRTGCLTCFADRYELRLASEQTVQINLSSDDFDTYLVLTDASGRVIAEDDDTAGNLNSRIDRTLAAGSYLVEASSFGSNETGPYTLTVSTGSEVPVRTIGVGQTVSATLAASASRRTGCVNCFADRYRLMLPAGTAVDIRLSSAILDTYLVVTDESGRSLAEDDDSGGNLNSRIARTLPAGTYLIEASSFSSGETGPYTLSVAAGPSGGGTGQALPISVNQTVQGVLQAGTVARRTGCGACLADRYSLTVTATQTVVITLTSGVLDPYLVLTSSTGQVIAEDDDSGGILNSRISRQLSPGSYLIEASTFSDGETGPYVLSVATPAAPRALSVPGTVNGTLGSGATGRTGCPSCPADVYSFTLATQQSLQIRLASTAFDAYLVLTDATGRIIAEDDDSGGGLNSLLSQTLTAGSYRLEAAAYSPGASGAYTLTVGAVGEPPPSRTIQVGQFVEGTLGSGSSRRSNCSGCFADAYTLTLTTMQNVTIRMNAPGFDAYLVLSDGNGRLITEDDDGGGDLNPQIVRTLAAGTYRIEASSFDNGVTGPYTLSVTRTAGNSGSGRPIQLGETVTGTLSPASGRRTGCAGCYADVYSFSLTETRNISIALNSPDLDTYLVLTSASGELVAEDDDSGGNANSRLVGRLAAGSYRIEASSFAAGTSGPYTLTVAAAQSDAPEEAQSCAVERVNGQEVTLWKVRLSGTENGQPFKSRLTLMTLPASPRLKASGKVAGGGVGFLQLGAAQDVKAALATVKRADTAREQSSTRRKRLASEKGGKTGGRFLFEVRAAEAPVGDAAGRLSLQFNEDGTRLTGRLKSANAQSSVEGSCILR